jgi:hypothetical protein
MKVSDFLDERNAPARCPVCGHSNSPTDTCKHVRWTFAQGSPIEFARRAVAESPCTERLGRKPSDISRDWWDGHGDRVIELIERRFVPLDGYVFGHIADLDLLSRDVWNEFAPQPERASIQRV